MSTARERRAARRERGGSSVDLNLVSLIDVFTILIFFLLAQVGPAELLASPKAVQLPQSTTDKAPRDALVLVVSPQDLLVDGRRIAAVKDVAAQQGDIVAALAAELELQARRVAVRAENRKATHPITILADKEIPYHVLKKVMATCAAANFGDVSFGLRHKEGKEQA